MSKRKRWRYKTGMRGATAIAFEREPGGVLYLARYIRGVLVRESLRHRDKELARRQAVELAAKLAQGEDGRDRPVSLAELIGLSERESNQSPRVQAQYRAHAECWLNYLGPSFDMRAFGLKEWTSFTRDRMAGRIDALGRVVRPGERRPVGERIVAAALQYLRRACKLATMERVGTGYLLARDPTTGLPLPRNPNPQRGVYNDQEYEALLMVADRVHEYLWPLLVLCNETGRRMGAVAALRWSDWLEDGSILWRADSDKLGKKWITPITHEAKAALERVRRERPGVGDALLSPQPTNPNRPVARQDMREWLVEAERLAGIEHIAQRGWHGFRRRFATQRRHLPPKDVAYLGGWISTYTMQQAYEQVDRDGLAAVLADKRPLVHAVR